MTIQNATLLSDTQILVQGTSNCPDIVQGQASLTEASGATGTGDSFSQGSTAGNWDVVVDRTSYSGFVKSTADVSASLECFIPLVGFFSAADERSIPVN
jgi:hypothetical protein